MALVYSYSDIFLAGEGSVSEDILEKEEILAIEEFSQIECEPWLKEKLITYRVYLSLSLARLEGTEDGQKSKYDYYLQEFSRYYYMATGKMWKGLENKDKDTPLTIKAIKLFRG